MAGRSLLVFGGTFDPPHRAHTELPPLAAARLGCRRIIYVPAAMNPLKQEQPTPAAQRVAMLRLALSGIPDVEIDTCEVERPGPSYTVDTLESLGARHGPDAVFFLLMGSDQALEFRRWRRWRRVLELATPAVMLRPPHTPESFRRDLEAEWEPAEVRRWLGWTLDIPRLDIHATDLRRRLERREDVESRLHDDVLRYIREHGLYRSGPPQKTALAT